MFNLASAFRLRNKLKEKISNLTDAIDSAEFSKTVGSEENTSPCDGMTLMEAIVEVCTLMDLLLELNGRIEKANASNREPLIELETLKAKIAFYEKLVRKCRQGKTYEFEYDEEGERVKVAKEALVDQGAVTSVLAALKKEKDALEDKLTTVNFNTAVDFDPEKVLARI
jgi:hypothetical protein